MMTSREFAEDGYKASQILNAADQLEAFLKIAVNYVTRDLKMPIEEVLNNYRKTKTRLAIGA